MSRRTFLGRAVRRYRVLESERTRAGLLQSSRGAHRDTAVDPGGAVGLGRTQYAANGGQDESGVRRQELSAAAAWRIRLYALEVGVSQPCPRTMVSPRDVFRSPRSGCELGRQR